MRAQLLARLKRDSVRGRLVALLVASSCGFGHAVDRPDRQTLIENLGANRYEYLCTQMTPASARGPAAPSAGTLPAGARDLGLVEVSVEYSGLGSGGLRASETDFYPTLAKLAGEMGGTHFLVTRSARETRMGNWITSLTVEVVVAE